MDNMWIFYPHCGKPAKLGKNRKCKNEIHAYTHIKNGINKPIYELSTVFHHCGKPV